MSATVYRQKANENFKIAEIAFREDCYNVSVSRAYYSMLQAAIALLIENGLMVGQKKISHEWVQANFSSKIIKEKKLVDSKFRSYLHTVQELRNKADYSQLNTSQKVAQRTLSKAREFLKII